LHSSAFCWLLWFSVDYYAVSLPFTFSVTFATTRFFRAFCDSFLFYRFVSRLFGCGSFTFVRLGSFIVRSFTFRWLPFYVCSFVRLFTFVVWFGYRFVVITVVCFVRFTFRSFVLLRWFVFTLLGFAPVPVTTVTLRCLQLLRCLLVRFGYTTLNVTLIALTVTVGVCCCGFTVTPVTALRYPVLPVCHRVLLFWLGCCFTLPRWLVLPFWLRLFTVAFSLHPFPFRFRFTFVSFPFWFVPVTRFTAVGSRFTVPAFSFLRLQVWFVLVSLHVCVTVYVGWVCVVTVNWLPFLRGFG